MVTWFRSGFVTALIVLFTIVASLALADETTQASPTDPPTAGPAPSEPPPVEPESPADDDAGGEPVDGEAGDGSADEGPEFDPLDPEQAFREIVFPVVGPAWFSATYGACRDGCSREHKGTDISTSGWKGGSVVAAHDGVVTATRYGGGLSGCSVEITADDGWMTRYLHLNDDVAGTDLSAAPCVAPGIEIGTFVQAGTLLGWVGDSGNAEHTTPHLHFEIRNPEGLAVEPYYSLVEAHRIEFEWLSADDILAISAAGFEPGTGTVFVIDETDLSHLALAGLAPTTIDGPLIPIDAADPITALAALKDHSPERIVVLSNAELPVLATTVAPYAPIVAVGSLPMLPPEPTEARVMPPADGPAPEPEATETDPDTEENETSAFVSQAVPDRFMIVIAGRDRDLPSNVHAAVENLGVDRRIVLWDTTLGLRGDFGVGNGTHPDRHADQNALWWNTGDGWQSSLSVDGAPQPGFALISARGARPWTLAYLSSLAVAPNTPLWYHDPPPRPSPSL